MNLCTRQGTVAAAEQVDRTLWGVRTRVLSANPIFA